MNFDPKFLSLQKMGSWERYDDSLEGEYRQCFDEGLDVEEYKPLIKAISGLSDDAIRLEFANVFFEAMQSAKMRTDYPYEEPDELSEIQAQRTKKRPLLNKAVLDDKLKDKIRGAWLGRTCGCLLGKPVEGMKSPEIAELLKNSENYPIARYMTLEDLKKTPRFLKDWGRRTWADCLEGDYAISGYPTFSTEAAAPADDDTNYTIMAAKVLVARYGRDFTPDDVANTWVDSQPKNSYCTAERRAFRNFVMGIRPPQSAVFKNPDREFIGAQIRADYFGYINPGDPQTAADMAWRDACISHVKNGIYGEMFVAAMIAAAAVSNDLITVIEAGLGEIPVKCRLTHNVRLVMNDYRNGVSEEECFAHISDRWDEYKSYDWVHTISNAEIVTASLLYGEKDYGRSIARAVMTGFDTDCNGATVGSVLGMMLGAGGIEEKWTAPIKNKIKTSIFGIPIVTIDEMVELTMSHMPR